MQDEAIKQLQIGPFSCAAGLLPVRDEAGIKTISRIVPFSGKAGLLRVRDEVAIAKINIQFDLS
jgi:hypothetical protein